MGSWYHGLSCQRKKNPQLYRYDCEMLTTKLLVRFSALFFLIISFLFLDFFSFCGTLFSGEDSRRGLLMCLPIKQGLVFG